MAILSFQLDPNAASYTDNQIVDKVNAASNDITRASSVSAAARPIGTGEIGDTELGSFTVTNAELAAGTVGNTELSSGVAAANLDAMSDTARGYIKTSPTTGEFPVVSLQRAAGGNLDIDYDNVAI